MSQFTEGVRMNLNPIQQVSSKEQGYSDTDTEERPPKMQAETAMLLPSHGRPGANRNRERPGRYLLSVF